MNDWNVLLSDLESDTKAFAGIITCIEWIIKSDLDNELQWMTSLMRVSISSRKEAQEGLLNSVTLWVCSDGEVEVGFESRRNIGNEQKLEREKTKCKNSDVLSHFVKYMGKLETDNKASQNRPSG